MHFFLKVDCDLIQPHMGINIHLWKHWNEFEVFPHPIVHFQTLQTSLRKIDTFLRKIYAFL